jgi:hypothetical protein
VNGQPQPRMSNQEFPEFFRAFSWVVTECLRNSLKYQRVYLVLCLHPYKWASGTSRIERGLAAVFPANDDQLGMICRSGFRNVQYGVWRSRCCGDEIVLYDGFVFPRCNRHSSRLTEWVLISKDLLRRPNVVAIASRAKTSGKSSPLPHLLPERLMELSTGSVVSSETESTHLMTCQPCRSALEQFALEYYRPRLEASDREKSA